jgi:hypothetical protein
MSDKSSDKTYNISKCLPIQNVSYIYLQSWLNIKISSLGFIRSSKLCNDLIWALGHRVIQFQKEKRKKKESWRNPNTKSKKKLMFILAMAKLYSNWDLWKKAERFLIIYRCQLSGCTLHNGAKISMKLNFPKFEKEKGVNNLNATSNRIQHCSQLYDDGWEPTFFFTCTLQK